jgi:nitrite reductase (NO-forming)
MITGRKLKAACALTVAVLALPLVSACMHTSPEAGPNVAQTADATFTLRTVADDEGLGFVGVGGEIDSVRNPQLNVTPGSRVKVTLENGDGAEHDISFPDFDATAKPVSRQGMSTSVTFEADKEGSFAYFCTFTGHRAAGMEGEIVVGEAGPAAVTGADIVRPATELPGPLAAPSAEVRRFELETVELEGQLADGTTYPYWTFSSTVPGPFLRARVGETVEVVLRNPAESKTTHSIDLHAVTGPGGGATVMQVPPGEEKSFTFKALNPGLYIYHCATPSVAHHMASGMYGLILIEPEGGLPPVDHEFYVAQGEIYTIEPAGTTGAQEFDQEKMLAEQPEYWVLNGAVGALSEQHPLQAEVGDTVRIFYGVGGPNGTASFHVIGEIFDRVYDQASLTSAPLTNVQTTTVAPGGATMVEFTVEVPGRYLLVDHALSRLERGLVGFLEVTGPENHEIFHGEASGDNGGH